MIKTKIKILFISIFIIIIIATLIKIIMKYKEGIEADGSSTDPKYVDNFLEKLLIGLDTISYMFPNTADNNKIYYEKLCENLNYSSDFKTDLTSVKTLKDNFEKTPSNILFYFKEIFDNLKSVNYVKYNIDEIINLYNEQEISILINDVIENKSKIKTNEKLKNFIEKVNKFITFIKKYNLDLKVLDIIDIEKLELLNLPNIQDMINNLQLIKPENPTEIYPFLDIYFTRLQIILIKGIVEKEHSQNNSLCISNFNEPLHDVKYSDYVCNEGENCVGYECGKNYGICKTNNTNLDNNDIDDLFKKASIDILNKENISFLKSNTFIVYLFSLIQNYEPQTIENLKKHKMEIEIFLDNLLNNNINLIENKNNS